jgi:hypothetical protein
MNTLKLYFIYLCVFTLLVNTKLLSNNDYFRAMQDEMNRSMKLLKLDNMQKPYYIEYSLEMLHKNRVDAKLGKLYRSTKDSITILLNVSVRVGDYKLDQKNFVDVGLNFFGTSDDEENYTNRRVPNELDYMTLRRELWLATDAAYKEATELYSKKEASLKGQIRKDTLWDFSKATSIELVDTMPLPDFNIQYFEDIARTASSEFVKYPSIQQSNVTIYFDPSTIYYLNSEGTKYIKNDYITSIEIAAMTQAEDGMPLSNYYCALGWLPDDLPTKDSILKATRETAITLDKLVNAPVLEDTYTGPILFMEQPACEAFAQTFLPCLTAQRSNSSSKSVRFSVGGTNTAVFQTKIGGRVLPEFLSIESIPEVNNYNEHKLFGGYKIDEQGVKPQNLTLVKDGYLKTLLNDRTPIKRVEESNGACRGGSPMASNIKIDANKKYQATDQELKNQLLKLCKQRDLKYGLIVKKVQNVNMYSTQIHNMAWNKLDPIQSGSGKFMAVEVYKIYPDGREELIRGGNIVGLGTFAFKDIIKIGNTQYILNYLQMPSFKISEPRYYTEKIISIIGQPFLLEDGEYQLIEGNFSKPPMLDNPIGMK